MFTSRLSGFLFRLAEGEEGRKGESNTSIRVMRGGRGGREGREGREGGEGGERGEGGRGGRGGREGGRGERGKEEILQTFWIYTQRLSSDMMLVLPLALNELYIMYCFRVAAKRQGGETHVRDHGKELLITTHCDPVSIFVLIWRERGREKEGERAGGEGRGEREGGRGKGGGEGGREGGGGGGEVKEAREGRGEVVCD